MTIDIIFSIFMVVQCLSNPSIMAATSDDEQVFNFFLLESLLMNSSLIPGQSFLILLPSFVEEM